MTFQSPNPRLSISELLFAILAWSLLILRFGYRFGTGDQVELLPYSLYLNDHSLYAKDFFIQGLHASVPNERTVMATLLQPFLGHLELWCFIFHFLSTVVLVLGLSQLAQRFIENKYVAWFATLIALIPLNDYGLGNVELYSECFQASGLAVAVVVWALHFFLNRKYVASACLLSVATFIQLLDGLDVTLVLTPVLFWAVIQQEERFSVFLKFIVIYALTAGIYLILILSKKTEMAAISNEQLFAIVFEFRHPHHFIFSSFPKLKVLVFALLSVIGIFYFYKRSKSLFRFLFLAIVGLVVYTICTDRFHLVLVGNFQFYKVTPWIKFLGVLALLSFVEGWIRSTLLNEISSPKSLMVAGTAFCWILIIYFHNRLPYHVPFQLFDLKYEDDLISMCEKIKHRTPLNAVFIQPFENTELKFYAQRSSYVEYKANVKNRKFVLEWCRRLKGVYGLSLTTDQQGFSAEKNANNNFHSLSSQKLSQLNDDGVTHILTHKKFPPSKGSLILQNSTYAVYQL